jgi:hypothetical protein
LTNLETSTAYEQSKDLVSSLWPAESKLRSAARSAVLLRMDEARQSWTAAREDLDEAARKFSAASKGVSNDKPV